MKSERSDKVSYEPHYSDYECNISVDKFALKRGIQLK